MTTVWYTTREAVQAALDVRETARNTREVDSAIASATPAIHGLLRRRFYPHRDTRYFRWPARPASRPWRLWLGQDEVISVDTIIAGGVEIPTGSYFLEPANAGPPFTHIEVDLSSGVVFQVGPTHQRNIEIQGVFGYSDDEAPAGQLASAIDSSQTTITVTDAAAVGVGHLLRVGDERMQVVDRRMTSTGQTLTGDLNPQAGQTTVPVSDGSGFHPMETVLVGGERMLLVDVAGDTLVVRRAFDGSTLAAHSAGAEVYAARLLVVERGVLGTTAAAHNAGDPITRHVVPPLVEELAIAEAMVRLGQKLTGYAQTTGGGETRRERAGRSLEEIRADAKRAYGRIYKGAV